MRYLVQWRGMSELHTADFATEKEARKHADRVKGRSKNEQVVWFVSESWEAA